MEHHRLILAGIVVSALILAVALGRPSITGYLPTETISQGINLDVRESQRFYLQSGEPLSLRGFSLTGFVKGEGLVKAYLVNPATGERLLVCSNERKKGSAMAQITGLATINVVPGEMLDIIEVSDHSVGEDSFVNECIETCTLDSDFTSARFVLDVIVEPGASFTVSRMRFVVSK